ncbi:LVIVD repeat-containing protein [Halorubellus salinus]|uniref:LVIVD repeat-containing protein n=1 Tax=Halorubellus salinus TaxID=755309 RepID=UPI001D0795ED|nr:hypothetical protein [Halorubellus salinus]
MRDLDVGGRWSRRRVLAGIASVGVVDVLGDATGTVRASTNDDVGTGDRGTPETLPTVEPAGRLALDGVTEAVVDDDGETVYCALGDGFAVVDASNPFDPTVRYVERDLEHEGDTYSRMVSIRDVKVSGDRLLVPGPSAPPEFLSGFFLYDVSDPTSPERVAFQDLEFGPHNSFVDGDHVYLTGSGEFDEPVVVYDVAGDDPEGVARWSPTDADDDWSEVPTLLRNCHDVYVQDDVLYAAYWDAGTWVVDVSDPADPTALGHLGGHDPAFLATVDPLGAEFEELPGNSHSVQPSADGAAAFVGKEAVDVPRTLADGGPGGVECWDLRALDVDGAAPSLRSVLRPPEPRGNRTGSGWTAHNFGVDGDRLYTSWHGGGVRAYDVATLAEPSLLGEWRDPERTWFWTAKPLESGFVATSYLDPAYSVGAQRRGEGAHLYVFPEPSTADAVPAPTMPRREFPVPEERDD